MKTKFEKLTPMIYTNDLQGTIDYYGQVLGFKCVSFESDWGWAMVERDSVSLMISIPNDHIKFDKSTFTGSFYFELDDVDELWEQIRHKVKVAYPIEDFDYGMREFAIYDNNNYLLQFGRETQ